MSLRHTGRLTSARMGLTVAGVLLLLCAGLHLRCAAQHTAAQQSTAPQSALQQSTEPQSPAQTGEALPHSLERSVWSPDNGDGTYTNPVLYADYSDPDVIRVGHDYYLVSSSFSHFPGLPVLHSRDLVNWRIIGHAVPSYPDPAFDLPQRGMGIWAPAIRFHNGEYFIYFGDPDRGVFLTKAKHPEGPWTPLRLVRKVTGWIDTCPFWDDDGNAYLVHAWANSRVGVKSILAINRMNAEGTEILDDGIVVFVGHKEHPTIEGPKLHKRNRYYYIFAPAGGVKPGWQTVLRSRSIFGPYEARKVLEQGSTRVNGPHQGAWVDTPAGQDWFLHFQDRYAYGRVVHLQPMRWENDWPVIGVDYDGNGIGEPVSRFAKPDVGKMDPLQEPQTSDEFGSDTLALQWQWEANPRAEWISLDARKGWLRLYAQDQTRGRKNLWEVPGLLLQKFPAPSFSATLSLSLPSITTGRDLKSELPTAEDKTPESAEEKRPQPVGEKLPAVADGGRAGLVVFGLDYAAIQIEKRGDRHLVSQIVCQKANTGSAEVAVDSVEVDSPEIQFSVEVWPENPGEVVPKVLCRFAYSTNGREFRPLGKAFVVREGVWVGAKVGMFCVASAERSQGWYADVDCFRISGMGRDDARNE